ncbi:MAG: GGDEF domain-containing protein [Gemmatimonadetes bacterium]|nr:GGDEF domain-containing protein [Gemmatimonadota bacterium]
MSLTEPDNASERGPEETPEPGFPEPGLARLLRTPWSGSRPWILPACIALLVLVGVVDSLMVAHLSFWGLYLAPVGCAAWMEGSRAGYGMALVTAMGIVLIEIATGTEVMGRGVMAWNVLQSLAAYSAAAGMVGFLRERMEEGRRFAAIDALTSLPNRGSFIAALDAELSRSNRYGRAFTLAYLDLDNFKEVNDLEGHDSGDQLLKRVAETMRNVTRQSDVLGRLGGDEFAALLPETTFGAAKMVLEKLHKELNLAMEEGRWPVTCSIGAVTFETPVESSREALRLADGTMYAVKRAGKNGIQHAVWDGEWALP